MEQRMRKVNVADGPGRPHISCILVKMTFARKKSGRRLFIALPISKAFQEEILHWEMAYTKFPVRWLTGKNLHVTLIPPWHATDDVEVKELLAEVGSPAPIPLIFRRIAFGPDPHAPRLIWAEGDAPPALVALRDRIAEALGQEPAASLTRGEPRPANAGREHRPFRLHLTLARFREEQFPSFPIRTLDEQVDWRDTAHSFVLMESHLARTGADYEVRAEFPLRGV